LDYLKRAARQNIPTEDEYFLTQTDQLPSPEETALETEVKQQLYDRCNLLKKPYREIALDYFYHELSAADIATNSGKNLKTVQTQIYRAKAMLQKKYRKGIDFNGE
jgi:RNA polymerase sigma-70 factor (ECF subfamily)